MKELNIGKNLIKNRHKHGITQDELASYIGVSKASVSKWETAATYPDITLLPRLAAFFNISIDELMGYEPQMSKAEIRKLYRELTIEFASCPFEETINHCREIAKKYFSCFPLLFQIGSLYVNHSMLAGTPEMTSGILEEAREFFVRVKDESDDIALVRQALNMEALCLLQLGRASDVFDLLEPLEMPSTTPEPLLATAYQMTGNTKEAQKILQAGIYQSVLGSLDYLSIYMSLCLDDVNAFEETYQRAIKIAETFQLKTLHPGILLSMYISSAQGFMALGEETKALDSLEQYTELATGSIYPLHLHGDSFFYLLDDWFENTLMLGNELPRNESVVRKSMVDTVSENPVFMPLADNLRFQNLVKRLKMNREES